MKVLWQQLIAFLLVIIATVALFAYRIEDEMTTEIEQTREQQLLNYGYNIVNNNFSRNDLVRTSQLLASENIVIQVYLSDGRTIYPIYDQRFDANLSQEELQLIQSGQYLGFRTVDRYNQNGEVEPYLTVYLPHHDVGEFPSGFISLAAPLDDLQARLDAVRQNIFISLILAIIMGIIISTVYSILQTRKIHRLQYATRQIGQGNYDVTIATDGQDEFGDLSRDFQKMSHSLMESQEEIKRQEGLRRQFMMDVAHEMRTPLTTMSGLLEGLQHNMIPEKQRGRSLELIQRETKRLTRLVNENLDYEKIRSHQFVLAKQENDGNKLLDQIKEQLSRKAAKKNINILVEAEEGLIVWADYDRIIQILINLVTNAIQFSEDSDIILQGKMQEEYSEIKVIDKGIGIDPAHLKSIWERFYKVDESRKNTEFGESGIGLSVVQSLIEAHQGNIEVDSELGKGSVFTVKLPHKKESKL
ncbi:MAG TPA: HAMP domain-containing histidine kinase [Facklamia tabacinasalis]|uniref:histidine kinase n=1 Tax=Ruoffia tabacinasalis TaxID=87458 RepID=A0A5R9DVG3_9LACT|nr:HAMP domain-containing sensor histidine kinase [Ruoffia tabacinasalis]TLQ41532.1 HAMP domain-containing histidine kinase [Ruoffia tabacinasalis]HJG47635.1 HAMP domain-containing histidine kinase [Ruoffia tabacinasalis]